MKFTKNNSELFIWNSDSEKNAFDRTTHLAVAAHQDDIEFMAYHGIAECFANPDKGFSAIVVTDGAGSPRAGVYENYTDERMQEVRRVEQKKAAAIGEYATLSLLMYPSSEVKANKNLNVIDDIYKVLSQSKPYIVYTHNLADKHPTHVAVALRTIEAIRKMPKELRPKKLYGCEVWRALDWLNDDEKVQLDVGKKLSLAQALMGVFDSQISGGKSYDKATIGWRLANATYADDHEVDTFTHVTYAMDLTSLIENDDLNVADFILEAIERFALNVRDNLMKL